MKALVVYESIFNNTKHVAEAIARGLENGYEADVVEVGHAAKALGDIDLLVVGGPTHAWSMSRPTTRASGREQAEAQGIDPASDGIGVREWLDGIDGAAGMKVAAFDTGAGKIGFLSAGSAAKKIADRLDDKGFRLVAKPEQFLIKVVGGETFLKEGEEDRAQSWGAGLASAAQQN